ncbi:hypothetical protein [Chitinivibrio alkaliphilus]|uniref:Uncharacterized protein n=1 Tax=Chitinivibrio alkaliphilus ACht1 TaxID=1313304 RepID=U7DD30_9BACT|nr:hypothetical protein [Chitinivibrio alkaliphilus]ERP38776.1 hypothetical protein CALK_0800 [Chitinivibrio alkaliphilus ACht1]
MKKIEILIGTILVCTMTVQGEFFTNFHTAAVATGRYESGADFLHSLSKYGTDSTSDMAVQQLLCRLVPEFARAVQAWNDTSGGPVHGSDPSIFSTGPSGEYIGAGRIISDRDGEIRRMELPRGGRVRYTADNGRLKCAEVSNVHGQSARMESSFSPASRLLREELFLPEQEHSLLWEYSYEEAWHPFPRGVRKWAAVPRKDSSVVVRSLTYDSQGRIRSYVDLKGDDTLRVYGAYYDSRGHVVRETLRVSRDDGWDTRRVEYSYTSRGAVEGVRIVGDGEEKRGDLSFSYASDPPFLRSEGGSEGDLRVRHTSDAVHLFSEETVQSVQVYTTTGRRLHELPLRERVSGEYEFFTAPLGRGTYILQVRTTAGIHFYPLTLQ